MRDIDPLPSRAGAERDDRCTLWNLPRFGRFKSVGKIEGIIEK